MTRPKKLKFRPYARLLTMLGDQLIKNERVALVELIKNAYDADASWVKVTFEGFDADFRPSAGSRIIIEDDGTGMTRETIEQHWVNPATPMKLIGKRTQARTKKGRAVQGEKGIGRFALLKIGRDITITTRPARSAAEFIVRLDLSSYNTDFLQDGEGLFLDDLSLTLSEVSPAQTIKRQRVELGPAHEQRRQQGTRIEIAHLSGAWSREKAEAVYDDLTRLQSIFGDVATAVQPEDDHIGTQGALTEQDPFEVFIYRGTQFEPFGRERREQLEALLTERPVFKIEGAYDEAGKAFDFSINGTHQRIELLDERLSGLPVYRQQFMPDKKTNVLNNRTTECGPFRFTFYVFDFSAFADARHKLDDSDKKLIKEHRIYLYRDGIRVYPYGEPTDDWLLIDVRRGTVRASEFLSNDQVVGVVEITQQDNPQLRDKTSREGLVDVGEATDEFRALLQSFLAWVRKDPYAKRQIVRKKQTEVEVFKGNEVDRSFEAASEAIASGNSSTAGEKIDQARKQYKAERRYLVQRAENTEHLAGVGLSVEAASHDLMLGMATALRQLDTLIAQTARGREIAPDVLNRELSSVRGLLSFVEAQMRDMQALFKSTKQRRQNIRVSDVLTKVQGFYGTLLKKREIDFSVSTVGSPLQAMSTDAVLLQLFLNLFDNAVYWLAGRSAPRKIEVLLDGDQQLMIFADNGPGFRDEDLPYLFEPFFTGKGEEGRGLGLYIARQLLERQGYRIEVSERGDRILPGANLTISFIQGD
ncbi:ATP-binding protein [Stenotrophomonas sp. TEPEL]|uniref:sensor histidine kinase n=1 Tax=Stenotrophomonas sp. TEPEL TaxID=2283801 RepID=UPI001046EF28|nr:sensor histidine kinase [Stenotrophomonas sp. TEPEL]TDB34124.1 ATP-binding protein [Stenotrophomonas sp. TEPEL]